MLSLLQYSLYTHDCKAMAESKAILKCTIGNAVEGLIPHNDETTSSPGGLVLGEPPPAECQQNKRVDDGHQQRDYRSMSSAVQKKKGHTLKNFEVTLSLDLSWTHQGNVVMKAARQHLELPTQGAQELLNLHPRKFLVWEHYHLDGKLHQKGALLSKKAVWTIKIIISNLKNICTKGCGLTFLNSLAIQVTLQLLPLPED